MKIKLIKQTRLLIFVTSFLLLAATSDNVKNVLIIGDSISIGYAPIVQKALVPLNINIEHNPGNGGSTVRGVENIEKWLGVKQWDIILFNFGLHDLTYKDSLNKYDVINGKLAVPLDLYKKNLEIVVAKFRETKAKLIFITTTVVPENSLGRKAEDPSRYNAVAIEVMKQNGIEVLDLYTPSQTIHPENSKPGNVHYTNKGYELLANHVIKTIKLALKYE